MIQPFRYPVTLLFCLHEVEVILKNNPSFMSLLDKYRYNYSYFLEDFLCFFLKEYLYVSFLKDITEDRERLYLSFLSGTNKTEEELVVIHDTVNKAKDFCYHVWRNKIPVIHGYVEYQLDYRPKTNSFFFLFLI